jgi:hypothetical protein
MFVSSAELNPSQLKSTKNGFMISPAQWQAPKMILCIGISHALSPEAKLTLNDLLTTKNV